NYHLSAMPEIWRNTASILIAESKCSPFLSSSGSIERKGRIRCNRASERVKALFHTPRIANKKRRTLNFQRRILNYAGAPPRAPGRGGATSGATTCFGGLSGAGFLAGDPPTGGGGLIRRPWSMISLICEPSRVSYSSRALAMVSSLSRFEINVCLAN